MVQAQFAVHDGVLGPHVEVIDNAIRTGATIATAITAANGSFSFTLSEVPAGATVDVFAAGEDGVSAVTVPLTLKVVHPTTITGFKTTLNQNWGLSVSGCLGFPASDKTERIDAHLRADGRVRGPRPSGPWKKLA